MVTRYWQIWLIQHLLLFLHFGNGFSFQLYLCFILGFLKALAYKYFILDVWFSSNEFSWVGTKINQINWKFEEIPMFWIVILSWLSVASSSSCFSDIVLWVPLWLRFSFIFKLLAFAYLFKRLLIFFIWHLLYIWIVISNKFVSISILHI